MTNRDKLQIQINHLALDVFANIRQLIEASNDNILKYDINGVWFSNTNTSTSINGSENGRQYEIILFKANQYDGGFSRKRFDANFLPNFDRIVYKINYGFKLWRLTFADCKKLNYMIYLYDKVRRLDELDYKSAYNSFATYVHNWKIETNKTEGVFLLIDEFYSNIKQ
jgi:hypothetical protein